MLADNARLILTPWQIKRASRLRAARMAWDAVAKIVGSSSYVLRCHFEPGYRDRILANATRSRQGKSQPRRLHVEGTSGRTLAGIKELPSIIIPATVWAEREARMALEPSSITAALMGDPPFERSALAKRQLRLVSSR